MTLSSSSSSSYLTALAAGLGVGLGVGILALLRSPRRGRRNVKAQHVQVRGEAAEQSTFLANLRMRSLSVHCCRMTGMARRQSQACNRWVSNARRVGAP
jgi:hypothetical protein